MENARLDLNYNFLDSLKQANSRSKTLREMILIQEQGVEDPRVPEDLRIANVEARRQALFADEMKRLFGDQAPSLFLDNAPIGAFATNQLERLDMQIRHQALRTYATRDVPFLYGGGALESVKGFKETYQLPKGGFIGGDTNQVRLVNVDFQAQQVPVKPLTYGLRLGYIDSLKNDQIGYDAIAKNAEAISRAWNLDIDRIAYVGTRGENGSTTDVAGNLRGLLNLENVTTTDLETTANYDLTTKDLRHLPINKAIEIFIGELNAMASSVDWDVRLIPNKILIFKEYFAWLNQTAVNESGLGTPFRTNKAILQEALDNWSDAQNFDRLEMVMLPYLSHNISDTKDASMVSSGTNQNGRIVFYRQDPYVGYLPLPMDLTGGAIVYDVNTNAYRRNYVSFVGYYFQFYNESFRYLDNGATITEVSEEMQALIDGTTFTELSYVYATGVITGKITYPAVIDADLATYMLDVLIEVEDALPTATVASAVSIGGQALTPSNKVLTGRKKVWVSELFTEASRTAITGHAGLSNLAVVITISGNTSPIDTSITAKVLVSDDNFATWTEIAEKSSLFETPED